MRPVDQLLSFVTSEDGSMVTIHVDLAGLSYLIDELEGIRESLMTDDCPHTHLFSRTTGGALSITKLQDQPNEAVIVHHVKIYGWNEEWAARHGLTSRQE